MPRWLKVLLITAAVVVLLVVVGMFLLGDDDQGHGPGRHGLPGQAAGQLLPSAIATAHAPVEGDAA